MKIAVLLDENTKVMLLVVKYFQIGMVEYFFIQLIQHFVAKLC